MNTRERTLAVFNYQNYDQMPVVHFGYWTELLAKWHKEGHLTADEAEFYFDKNEYDKIICDKLGFDFCWGHQLTPKHKVHPFFEKKILETHPNGVIRYINPDGLIEETDPNTTTIPATIGTLMTGREAWEELYKPRLQSGPARHGTPGELARWKQLSEETTDAPFGVYAGSMFGYARDMIGVEALSYLQVDDEDLFIEIIDTVANLSFETVKAVLEAGLRVDFLHFWEDICFKNGPLINPATFEKYVAPHYKKITDMAKAHGVNLFSVDSDGLIDKLIPAWFANGVNIMFPIEVGTWDASIAPWREKYGRELRGVGGVRKSVLGEDRAAIDAEIERIKPLVDLGGYIPCPDHRISLEATWDNVRYYADRMRATFCR
ncbi:uroporphyrinogen decarboxylase family protein [Ereboglobus luteus]|uniref:Uroporphyrinogen decarboxylase (URO-D) domain-containing protein n=1 Tax=Ereboglobus luteus TaxID=1796921 RepID=A0A2U8E374_9BACT|nr:uroporphyrinogen decarboxylase family protein [Ereboglobus luteus]AWI09260.1 hypothetical protein CKA38_08410 [Ereboglobus luteus]